MGVREKRVCVENRREETKREKKRREKRGKENKRG
tara:strand:- start:192 stop:296 length:105 start_codon:yes stop_codon:yes gene_type:complete